MFKGFKKLIIPLTLLLIISFVSSLLKGAFGETITESIRRDLRERSLRKLVVAGKECSDWQTIYVEPKGVIISINVEEIYGYKGFTQENLNAFFGSLWNVFGTSKYPPTTRINFYIQIGYTDSLIVEFPIGALYDFYKEKITRSDFLKQCENI